MFFTSNTASLALAALLCSSAVFATPQDGAQYRSGRRFRRNQWDGLPDMSGKNAPPPVVLEPVIPPATNGTDLEILNLDKDVTLAWAASTDSTAGRRAKRGDAGVLSQGKFVFKHPTVALDHSSFVSNVACPDGKLTAVFTPEAYNYAKQTWANVKNLLFITGVDACGKKDQNEYFNSYTITFNDETRTILATGVVVSYKDVVLDMNLDWGDTGNHELKRAADKRDLFEAHGLEPRKYATFTTKWSAYLNDKWALGTDDDAPWPNAARLFKWDKSGGQKDKARRKGKPRNKQGLKTKPKANPKSSSNSKSKSLSRPKTKSKSKSLSNNSKPKSGKRDLAERESEVGLALYCVDCGVRGEATVWGEIEASFLGMSVKKARAGIKAEMHAGIYLGVDAYVKYEKSWGKDFSMVLPGGFKIPMLVEVGPFVSIGVEAKVNINATGQLLVGADVNWNDIDVMVDLIDLKKSTAKGFKPTFQNRTEAEGELSASASLGTPIKLGVGIKLVGGLWDAEGALKDTPSINAEGKFKASYEKAADGTVTKEVDNSCYGIDYSIFFGNTVEAYVSTNGKQKVWQIMDPYRGPAIAAGCIGYVPEPKGEDICGATEMENPSEDTTCKAVKSKVKLMGKFSLAPPTDEEDLPACALKCLQNENCQSFSFSDKKSCQLNNVPIEVARYFEGPMAGPNLDERVEVFDKDCFDPVPCEESEASS